MPEMKRNLKDSVFTYLFSDPKYTRELYLYLHPEDTTVTEADCKLVTSENILSDGLYNDLGIQVRDILIILTEAQSTFSPNLPIRMLLYLARNYKKYIDEHNLRLYSTKSVALPQAELYMVYSGRKCDVPETLCLSELCGGGNSIEVTVKILRGGDNSIVGQYVDFCRISDEQRNLYGSTRKAIQETIRICQEKGILVPFLTARREEVIDIMDMLFSQEEVWEIDRRIIAKEARDEGRREGIQQGIQEGMQKGMQQGIQQGIQEGKEAGIDLFSELLKRLEPSGRISELIAAAADRAKLSALAHEFGLEL